MTWNPPVWGPTAQLAAAGVPLPPSDPPAYLKWLLQYQQPVGGPGAVLSPDFLWMFDNLTDVVGSETLVEVGTVPLTDFSATPDSTVNIQSPLARGFATFTAASGDALNAGSASVQDIVTSGLIVWCGRVPVAPAAGTEGMVSKRQTVGDLNGYRNGMNFLGQVTSTIDAGASDDTITLTRNQAGEQVKGTWHCWAMYVDASRTIWQIASDEKLSATMTSPGGLASTAVLSFGAGSGLQSAGFDLLLECAFLGSQVEGVFQHPDEPASGSNDPTGSNICHNVCSVLALDMVRGIATDALL